MGIKCPRCESNSSNSKGKVFIKKLGYMVLDRKCKDCGRRFYHDQKTDSIWNNRENIFPKNDVYVEMPKIEIPKLESEQRHNEKEVTVTDTKITSLEELKKRAGINEKEWIIKEHKISSWLGNWSVKAEMVKRNPDKQILPVIKPIRFNLPKKRADSFNKMNSLRLKGNIKTSLIFADSQIGFLKNQQTGELIPFHDRKCIDVILQIIEDINPDEVILLGDMLDMTEASKYEKKKEFYFTLQPAINELGYLLSKIRNIFDGDIIFLNGNHEIRLNKAVQEHMLYAYQVKPYGTNHIPYSLNHLLGMDDLGITFIEDYPSGEYYINNKLKVIHGEYVNIKKELERTNVSVIQAHGHSIERLSKTFTGTNEQITVTQIGCTCHTDDRVPGKVSNPDWQEGFAVVKSTDNRFNINHVVVIDGKCIYGDKIYQGIDYENEIKDILRV